jgi:predicted lipoprotein with Yx(FWY)xxD motif
MQIAMRRRPAVVTPAGISRQRSIGTIARSRGACYDLGGPMKRSLFATTGLAGVALLAAACGGSSGGYGASSTPPTSAAPAASSATATTVALGNSKLGQILVDSQGRSLYLFEADSAGTSTCISAGCVAEWPPLTAATTPQVGTGLAANRLGTTTRADGHQQLTYAGHPLYYFAGDTQPGVTAGQGLNDNGGLWYLVHNDGTPVDRS